MHMHTIILISIPNKYKTIQRWVVYIIWVYLGYMLPTMHFTRPFSWIAENYNIATTCWKPVLALQPLELTAGLFWLKLIHWRCSLWEIVDSCRL